MNAIEYLTHIDDYEKLFATADVSVNELGVRIKLPNGTTILLNEHEAIVSHSDSNKAWVAEFSTTIIRPHDPLLIPTLIKMIRNEKQRKEALSRLTLLLTTKSEHGWIIREDCKTGHTELIGG